MELHKMFLVLFDSTKLNPFIHNNPVKNREKNIANDDEEGPKNSESSSDKKKEAREKFVAPICGEITLLKESIKTQKVTKWPNFITQSEALEPK